MKDVGAVTDHQTPGGLIGSMINAGMFSSATVEWSTPDDFYQKINAEFGPFTLDPCSTKENAKCARFFTKEDNGLAQHWSGRVWMNPPYGREIGRWMEKARKSADNGAVVVCLVPCRTDTAWWHNFAMTGEIRFIRGRLKFGGHKNPAPFPCALVVFTERDCVAEADGGGYWRNRWLNC